MLAGAILSPSCALGETRVFRSGDRFSLDTLGDWCLPQAHAGIPIPVWQAALQADAERKAAAHLEEEPSPKVVSLAQARQQARANQDWSTADALREQMLALGWQIKDTPGGSQLFPLDDT